MDKASVPNFVAVICVSLLCSPHERSDMRVPDIASPSGLRLLAAKLHQAFCQNPPPFVDPLHPTKMADYAPLIRHAN
jgi:hypothetical protein